MCTYILYVYIYIHTHMCMKKHPLLLQRKRFEIAESTFRLSSSPHPSRAAAGISPENDGQHPMISIGLQPSVIFIGCRVSIQRKTMKSTYVDWNWKTTSSSTIPTPYSTYHSRPKNHMSKASEFYAEFTSTELGHRWNRRALHSRKSLEVLGWLEKWRDFHPKIRAWR